MNLDIRTPIGLLFLIIGALLAVFGLATHFTDPALYDRSLGVNVNLWWGLAMLIFGGAMFHYGRRATARLIAAAQNP